MRILSTLALLLVACQAVANPPVPTAENTVVIGTEITRSTMAPVVSYLVDGIRSNTLPSTVHMVINSPGGSVGAGQMFITLMEVARSHGTRFVCYVPGLAASMAFSILMHCDERYALSNAMLLWHRARISFGGGFGGGEAMTGPQLLNFGQELMDTDDGIVRDLLHVLGEDMSRNAVLWHFERETLHTGTGLHKKAPHFITSYHVLAGVVEALLNDKLVHSARGGLFDEAEDSDGEIVYIWSRWRELFPTTSK